MVPARLLSIIVLFLTAELAISAAALLGVRRGTDRSIKALVGLLVAIAFWSSLNAFEHVAETLRSKQILSNLEYLGIVSIPVLWFRLGHDIGRPVSAKPKQFWAHFSTWIIPIATAILVWFDPLLGLVRRNLTLVADQGFVVLGKGYGPWFYVHTGYSYLLILVGSVELLRALAANTKPRRIREVFVLGSVFLPLLGNALYVFLGRGRLAFDPTPPCFALAIVIVLLEAPQFGFLFLVPTGIAIFVQRFSDGLFIRDAEGRLVFANERARAVLGLEAGDIGLRSRELAALRPLFAEVLEKEGTEAGELLTEETTGRRRYELRTEAVMVRGRNSGTLLSLHDVTRRAAAEAELQEAMTRLEEMVKARTLELEAANTALSVELERGKETQRQLFYYSLHDPLTGLPNRSLLLNRLEMAIERVRRDPGKGFGVLFLDFDGFKRINDSYGHNVGDAFLREVALRLKQHLRGIDTAARLGGDEFVLILDGIRSETRLLEAAERIAAGLSIPFHHKGEVLIPTASIGGLLGGTEYLSPEELIRDADIAMYQAKEGGKNRVVIFEASMRERLLERNRLIEALRHTLAEGGFRTSFQPIVNLPTATLAGCEVLARWPHPELGLVSPERFIPLAEEVGLIEPLGQALMRQSFTAVAEIKRRALGCRDFFVSINISAIQLSHNGTVESLLDLLGRQGLSPASLCLELKATDLASLGNKGFSALQRLRLAGIRFVVDAVGPEGLSVEFLNIVPLDILKLGRELVADLAPGTGTERRDAALAVVKEMASLGAGRGFRVAAEGIEDPSQASLLSSCGCSLGQGYYFGRPMGAEEFGNLMGSCIDMDGSLPRQA